MSYIHRSHFRDDLLLDNGRYPVSIFCSGNDSEEGIAVSIILQLLRYKVEGNTSQSRFRISKFQPGNGRLDFNRILWELLTILIKASPGMVLIIDGIDKLDFPIRSSFLHKLYALGDDAIEGILISSVKNDDTQRALGNYPSIYREKERGGEFLCKVGCLRVH